MRTLFDEFIAITRALNVAEIEYAVCGGWAMAVHVLPRTTQDLDLLILTKDLDKILDLLEKFGFDIKGLPLHIDVEIRRVSKISEENQLITVDLL
ncbi:MAG TPA: hypothetical protein VK918_08840, partial [Pyrinomonadaceae bacterium]|nr:hypothetical protein [Pyrinomonadaceae bacterium]